MAFSIEVFLDIDALANSCVVNHHSSGYSETPAPVTLSEIFCFHLKQNQRKDEPVHRVEAKGQIRKETPKYF